MMKHDCDIVRDLMPLCIDNNASEKSRQMVGEHVLECKQGMEIYQEVRTEVPKAVPVSKDAEPFRRTVRKLRKKRKTRRIIAGVIGTVIGIMAFLIFSSAYALLTTDYAQIADDEDYGFALSRRTNGQIVVMHYNYNGKTQDVRWTFDKTTGILTFYAVTPTWALKSDQESKPFLYNDLYWDNDRQILMIRKKNAQGAVESCEVKEVLKGAKFKGNGYLYQVLYVQGNDIPMVNPSMDAAYEVPETVQDGMTFYSMNDPLATVAPTQLAPFMTPTPMPTSEPQETLPPQGTEMNAFTRIEATPVPTDNTTVPMVTSQP